MPNCRSTIDFINDGYYSRQGSLGYIVTENGTLFSMSSVTNAIFSPHKTHLIQAIHYTGPYCLHSGTQAMKQHLSGSTLVITVALILTLLARNNTCPLLLIFNWPMQVMGPLLIS